MSATRNTLRLIHVLLPTLLFLLLLPALTGCEPAESNSGPADDPPALPGVDTGFPDERKVVITGGQYFDVHRGEFRENSGIVAINGRFMKVDRQPEARDLEDAVELELEPDQYILPGIVDLHAHYNMDLVGEGRVDEMVYNPLIYLANGATSTFPAGEYDPDRVIGARDRINSGAQIGPRILNSGPYHGSSNPRWDEVQTEQQIRDLVDQWAAAGVAGFKAKGANPQELEVLIDQAHKHGLTVTGHLDSGRPGTTNSRDAIRMGIDRVEHILGGHVLDPEQAAYPVWNQVDTTDAAFRAIVDKFLKYRVHFNATITAPVYFGNPDDTPGFDYWEDERTFFTPYVQELWQERREGRTGSGMMGNLHDTMMRTTKAFYDAGGGDLITLGTDKPSWGDYLPGFSVHREMYAMVRAGIPEVSVLQIATLNGAQAINQGELLGSIETGKLADLFVVTGNPLDDITRTRHVDVVMKNGRLYDPESLLDAARGEIGPSGEDDHDRWVRPQ